MRNRFTLTQEEAVKVHTSGAKDFCKNTYQNLIIIRSTDRKDRPCLTIFKGRSAKPVANYYYPSYERREEAIAKWKVIADSAEELKIQRKKEKKEAGTPKSEVGTIFVDSWGYDQTNVDYYQIIERPSAHFAIVRQIGSTIVEGSQGMDCRNVMAEKDAFCGEPFRVKLTKPGYRGKDTEYFKVKSYSSAHTWDGTSNYSSSYA